MDPSSNVVEDVSAVALAYFLDVSDPRSLLTGDRWEAAFIEDVERLREAYAPDLVVRYSIFLDYSFYTYSTYSS